jgi:hypothetical protein
MLRVNGDAVPWANWSEFARSSPEITTNVGPELQNALDYAGRLTETPILVFSGRVDRSGDTAAMAFRSAFA